MPENKQEVWMHIRSTRLFRDAMNELARRRGTTVKELFVRSAVKTHSQELKNIVSELEAAKVEAEVAHMEPSDGGR